MAKDIIITWFLCYTTVSDIEMRDVFHFVDDHQQLLLLMVVFFYGPFHRGHCPMEPGVTGEGSRAALGQSFKVQRIGPCSFLF